MAQANVFYKGEEKKFAINIEAEGFNMDTDDFDIEVSTQKAGDSVKASKGASTEQLAIFYETVTPQEGDPYKEWYGIIDTSAFQYTGDLKVIATAYIPDANANDGVRKSIDLGVLGTLKNA